jgi:two-component system sensor histidine kinase UhpB
MNLRLASLGFAIYALTQIFVHPLQVFPATIINRDSFLAVTGLPIQVARSAMAALIAWGFLRALQAMERERRSELVAAHQARIAALEQREGLRRDLLRHVVIAQEDERARIARELHDETAQLLSAFSLDLGALRTKLKRADTTELVGRLQDLSHQMSQGLFHLMRDLRPSHLDDLGLVPALNFLLNQDCQAKGLEVAFDVSGTPKRLNGLVETVLFRVAQEALANVVRHAQVSQARVQLNYVADRVTLRICDQGLGFDPVERFHPPRGWGLAGMRERVESVAGQLTLQSAPGQGTIVAVEIPVDDEHGKDLVNGSDHAIARG